MSFIIIIIISIFIYIISVIIARPQALPGSNKSSSWGDAGGTRQLHRRGGWGRGGGVRQGCGWQQQVGEWDQHCWQERSISKYLQVMFSTQVNMFIFWLTRKSTAALFQVNIGSPPCQNSAIWSKPWILPKPRKNQSYSKIKLQLKQMIFPCQTCKSVVQRKILANPPLILKFPPSHKLF